MTITPRYEFGYGLTYSEFTYTKLKTTLRDGVLPSFVDAYDGTLATAVSSTNLTSDTQNRKRLPWGGAAVLWDNVANVTMEVENIGNMKAAEVIQLYVGIPGAPEKQLRGYQTVIMGVGQKAQIQFQLTRRDLSVWSPERQGLVLQNGVYKIYVGNSVLNIPL